jgi:tripartite-type tricarboxylate transporter receptor subunit TctC
MVAYAKANPGKINFASTGHGSTPHLLIELFMHEAKVSVTHIPYKGAAPAAADMVAGVVDALFIYPSTVQGLIDNGKLRAVAVSGGERVPATPDTPTFAELGLPGVELGTWMVLALPANTPDQIVQKLADATTETLKEPSFINYFKEQGAILLPLRGERLADYIETQRPIMKELFERAKIEAE